MGRLDSKINYDEALGQWYSEDYWESKGIWITGTGIYWWRG